MPGRNGMRIDGGMIRLKRVYDSPAEEDGFRVLVERLWPRGITKAEAHLDLWMKDIAPGSDLRKWFAHDPAKWEEFSKRYEKELAENRELVNILEQKSRQTTVTLIYAAHDVRHNSAFVLKRIIEKNRKFKRRERDRERAPLTATRYELNHHESQYRSFRLHQL
jgi:uncharacterized protein YeaO (DUF488 family)